VTYFLWPLVPLDVAVSRIRDGHGLDPSMASIGLGGMTVSPLFLISTHCSTFDAVSFKL